MSPRARLSSTIQDRAADLVCIVVALFIGGVATEAVELANSYIVVNELLGLAAAVLLWWHRRAPLRVAALAFVAAAVAPMATGAAVGGVYAVAAYAQRPIPPGVVVLYLLSGATGVILFPDQEVGLIGSLVVGALLTVGAFGWGLAVRSRRQLLVALTDRADRVEAEQAGRIADARRAERSRIAAEMHDMLAHRLSMLSIHAGAIELRPESPTEDLARAAGIVRTHAHRALDELRAVIGLLREDAVDRSTSSIHDIESLVGDCRATGMSIDFTARLPNSGIPPQLSPHVYRITQEGLTNAMKHAPGRPVELHLAGSLGGDLTIEIVNPINHDGANVGVPGAGLGIVGLSERVEMLGGRLHHGVDAAGNHRLRATMPWTP